MTALMHDIDLSHLNHGRVMMLSVGADKTGACLYLNTGAPVCQQTALDLDAVQKLGAALRQIEAGMWSGRFAA